MLTKEQINKVEQSYRNGDSIVIQIGDKVLVAETVLKHRKEATIEFQGCLEVDESCFEPNGDYYGDVKSGEEKTYILDDPYADNPNMVASVYYDDEVKGVE